MSAETHEVLRKLPISELGAALAVAIIDNRREGEPIRAVYGLIAVAQVMAKHLPPVDQMLAALEMHRAAIDLLPPEPRRRPMTRQNGKWIELVKSF